MDYIGLASDLVRKCRAKGADEAEVYIEIGRELRIEIRNGDVETVQESSSHGLGVRVFNNGRLGFAHCNDLSEKALDHTLSQAVKFSANATADENNVLPDSSDSSDTLLLFDPGLREIPMTEKISLAKKTESSALKTARITKSAGAGYSESESKIFIANSRGMSKSRRSSTCGFGVSVVAEKGEQKSSGSKSCRRRFYADLPPSSSIATEAASKASEMLDPRMVKTQRAPVIFHPDVAYSLLGGLLAAVNGKSVLQGASFLGERLGRKIGSENITIIDDGLRPRGLASTPFDGEGVVARKSTIVEKGILKQYMYNTIAARRAGKSSTGNAIRAGFTGLPGIGPHNFYMEPGSMSPDEILRSTPRGLLLKNVTGYGINPVNGNFSGGAAGFWIENGRIEFPVKGLTIAGTADEMFAGIDMLGNDLDENLPFTAPTLRIRSLQIGGEN